MAYWEIGGKPLVVGRGDIADAVVDDEALSWGHFLIVSESDEYFLIDLNSSNGTWVRDRRVTAYRLAGQEFIVAGGSLFCFSPKAISTCVVPDTVALMLSSEIARARE